MCDTAGWAFGGLVTLVDFDCVAEGLERVESGAFRNGSEYLRN